MCLLARRYSLARRLAEEKGGPHFSANKVDSPLLQSSQQQSQPNLTCSIDVAMAATHLQKAPSSAVCSTEQSLCVTLHCNEKLQAPVKSPSPSIAPGLPQSLSLIRHEQDTDIDAESDFTTESEADARSDHIKMGNIPSSVESDPESNASSGDHRSDRSHMTRSQLKCLEGLTLLGECGKSHVGMISEGLRKRNAVLMLASSPSRKMSKRANSTASCIDGSAASAKMEVHHVIM